MDDGKPFMRKKGIKIKHIVRVREVVLLLISIVCVRACVCVGACACTEHVLQFVPFAQKMDYG